MPPREVPESVCLTSQCAVSAVARVVCLSLFFAPRFTQVHSLIHSFRSRFIPPALRWKSVECRQENRERLQKSKWTFKVYQTLGAISRVRVIISSFFSSRNTFGVYVTSKPITVPETKSSSVESKKLDDTLVGFP